MNKDQTKLAYAAYEPNNDEILCIICGVVVMKHSPTLKCGCSPSLSYAEVVGANVAHVVKYKEDMKSASITPDLDEIVKHLKSSESVNDHDADNAKNHVVEICAKLHTNNVSLFIGKMADASATNKLGAYIASVYKDIADAGFKKAGYKV